VLRRIYVYGFLQPAVNGKVRLLVAFDVVALNVHAV